MVHFLSLWFVPDMANIGLCCPHMPAYNHYQIEESTNPMGLSQKEIFFSMDFLKDSYKFYANELMFGTPTQ